jgi:uncharacterized membrane protein YsdA (DUF1294 family)
MEVLVYYLLFINFVTFVFYGIDKRRAVKEQWRISEKKLLTLIVLGGFLGALIGMQVFRHKTLKSSFLWKFWIIVAFWIFLVVRLLLIHSS